MKTCGNTTETGSSEKKNMRLQIADWWACLAHITELENKPMTTHALSGIPVTSFF